MGNGRYAWVILGCLVLAQLVMSIGAYAWGPLAPYLVDELGITRAQVGLLTSVLYLVAAVAATPLGFMVDRWGARVMLIFSLAVMGAAFLAMSKSGAYWIVLALSGLAGVGYGAINQISVKDLSVWFDASFRATALGIRQAGVTVGAALGAVLLPLVAVNGGWQGGAAFTGLVILLTAALSGAIYRDTRSGPPGEAAKAGRTGIDRVNVVAELRKPELMVNMLVVPLLAGGQAAIGTFLIIYLQEMELFGSEVSLGSFLTTVMVAGTLGRIGWGVVSDRLLSGDRIKTMIIISLTGLIGSAGMIGLHKGVSPLLVYLLAALMGTGFLGFHGVLFACLAEFIDSRRAGSVTGVMVSVSWAGIVIMPVIFGALADYAGYRWGWLMLAATSLLSMISYGVFLVRRRPASHNAA